MKAKPPLMAVVACAVLALTVLLGAADSARAATFNPTYKVTISDPQARANSDWVSDFDLPKGDAQFAAAVFFIPSEWEITPGDEIPIGAVVGNLNAQATLGIINGPCDSVLPVEFNMLNASIDPFDTVSYVDTNPEPGEPGYDRQDPGTDEEDYFEDREAYGTAESATANTLTDNAPDANPFPSGEFVGFTITIRPGTGTDETRRIVSNTADTVTVDSKWDTVPDNTSVYHVKSGLQDGIEKYPDFIGRVLDDELGDGQPLQPIRRSAGITIVAGANVLLQFLIFEPGTFIDEEIPYDESLGYPSVTLLQNAGDPDDDPIPGPITDFCSPLATVNVVFGVSKDNGCTTTEEWIDPICEVGSAIVLEEGATEPDESGIPLVTNPEEGTYTFNAVAASQRDADGDGIENSLDTCPLVPNEGDPRVKGSGDLDEDGLDAACDPNDDAPSGGLNSDQDADGFTNRQDNCPLVANGELEDSNRDTDDDTIGDACDPDPEDDDAQGELIIVELSQEVTIGAGGPPPDDGTDTPSDGGDDDGGGGAGIIIVIVIIAAVVVVGGGAFLLMRRRGA